MVLPVLHFLGRQGTDKGALSSGRDDARLVDHCVSNGTMASQHTQSIQTPWTSTFRPTVVFPFISLC
jgi:hypothetical protein